MTALIATDRLTFGYGSRPVLEAVSLKAQPGEFLAVLGNNGAGKSTLLDLLAGLRAPVSGQVLLAGRPLPTWPAAELARELSHLPQAIPAELPFTAAQLVAMGRYPYIAGAWQPDRWFDSPEDTRAVAEAMRRTGCEPWRDRPLATLSGGERQRVALAAVLAQQARILLLDEPSTFLDISQQIGCFELLRAEADRGRLCLAVTHDLNLALRFCTRLVVLGGGRIAHDLPAAKAARSPGWLATFSARLALHPGLPGQQPWIAYR